MFRKTSLIALLWVVWHSTFALAQNQSDKLVLLIPKLFGDEGLVVDTDTPDFQMHHAHFVNSFQSEFDQLNIALASQLTALPLPSPASGFTYGLDPASGVFTRSAQSFGPILAERAETIGKKKFTLGYSYQRFTFDSIENGDLNQVRAVFTHEPLPEEVKKFIPLSEQKFVDDVVTTINTVKTSFDQHTLFFTYGLTDAVDVSLAIPTVHASLQVSSVATIDRLSGSKPEIHYFKDPSAPDVKGTSNTFSKSGSATGLGDMTIRVKGRVFKWEHAGVAVGMDFRLPTGDEMNLLGSGAAGYKPFAALSFGYHRISPHINLGYQWNGKSVLAGDVVSGRKESLPDQFLYVGGVDIGVTNRLTVAFDVLGQRIFGSPRLFREVYHATSFDTSHEIFTNHETMGFIPKSSLDTLDGAVGFKFNPVGSLLLNFNVIFKMNDSGVRDKLTPLFGVAYTF